MKYIVIILLLPFLAFSQSKGVSPITPELARGQQQTASKNTYAVVVGISDYQDKDIPDLRFADKDAEAFANFLRSSAGGALDGDHLKVLTNQNATGAQFGIALDWLLEQTKEGDNVIIYFSGHGDVESKRISQPGYLLGWDAPSQVYMTGGTVNVRDLQDIVSTLSVTNKARVVVITDACHSGKLSGSEINGAQLTGQNLARQFANEVKILSCQPNEYSIEGEQWGGGRGAFSFHLVDALYGLADGNNDLSVTLQEVGRYLEDHVTAEVAPVSQMPMVLGNRTESLASVDAKLLSALRSGKTSQMQMLSPVASRGMEDEVLAGVDTTARELYRLFKQALKDKVFLEPAQASTAVDKCADAYYERLMAEPKMQRLHTTMTRNYAAALQDNAQRLINAYLNVDIPALAGLGILSKLKVLPRQLGRAADLLGKGHYMYNSLYARCLLFEGIALQYNQYDINETLGRRCLTLFNQSIVLEPQSPIPWIKMSISYAQNLGFADSALMCARHAANLLPNQPLAYTELAYSCINMGNQWELARQLLQEAEAIDSHNLFVAAAWGEWYLRAQGGDPEKALAYFEKCQQQGGLNFAWWHANYAILLREQGRFVGSELEFKKSIAIDSTLAWVWMNLGKLYSNARNYAEAELVCKKAIALDSTSAVAWNNLGSLYLQTRRFAEAEPVLKKAIALASTVANPRKHLGMVYFKTNRPEAARQSFLKAIELNPNYMPALLGMAYLLTADLSAENSSKAEGKTAEAIGYVEQAIGKGATMEQLEKDEDLAPLRAQKEQWEALMKKYFAKQFYYNLACEHSLKGELDQAFESLEQSLTNGWKDYDWMQQDTDLAKLREQENRWKALMKKHFPDKFKD